MFRISRLAKVSDYMIGMKIDCHSYDEEQDTYDGIWTSQVGNALLKFRIGEPIESSTLNQPVNEVEHDTHQHYRNWHLALTIHEEREDETPLEIVQLEESEQNQLRQMPLQGRSTPNR